MDLIANIGLIAAQSSNAIDWSDRYMYVMITVNIGQISKGTGTKIT